MQRLSPKESRRQLSAGSDHEVEARDGVGWLASRIPMGIWDNPCTLCGAAVLSETTERRQRCPSSSLIDENG